MNGCSFRMFFIIAMLSAIVISIFACSPTLTVDNTTVKTLDLNRYMGTWYEVARFDHTFERDLIRCTATYTMKENGTIQVMNRGMKKGKWKTSEGKGKTTAEPGVLRVSFFGPFYSDYRVLMLAPDYSYALIGGSGDDFLWILSRAPQLSQETHDRIVREARRRGYQTDKLIWVDQSVR